MRALPALIQVSFQNIIRQSFFFISLIGAYLFISATPAFTMFTFFKGEKLVLDMSMAMILLTQLLVSILATSSIVGGEMEGASNIRTKFHNLAHQVYGAKIDRGDIADYG